MVHRVTAFFTALFNQILAVLKIPLDFLAVLLNKYMLVGRLIVLFACYEIHRLNTSFIWSLEHTKKGLDLWTGAHSTYAVAVVGLLATATGVYIKIRADERKAP